MKTLINVWLAALAFLTTLPTYAEINSTALQLEQQWAEALLLDDMETRAQSLEQLMQPLDSALAQNPDNAELLIIKGNTNLEIANALNSMKSLSYLKEGRKLLEQAIKLEPMAMDGMAEASLAAAIYWAPGWPLSFGDKDEAMELFEKSLHANPDSMEILTQYGHILRDSGAAPEKVTSIYHQALLQSQSPAMAGRDALRSLRKKEIQARLNPED